MSERNEMTPRGSSTVEAIDDEARLQVLHDLHVLDTAREDRFDRLTMLCTLLFDVPIAAITLIDRDRQWFKSKQGLDVVETRREDAFCNVTIQRSDLFEVQHASTDPNFKTNPYVLGVPKIEYYAGYPLESQGQRLGALCIMDQKTHALTPDEAETLRDLAAWVQTEFERDEERERAAEVQRGLLPPAMTPLEGYEVAGRCIPSREVGGDFFDWSLSEDGVLALTVGDVMGKGISAAVIMATVRAAMKTIGRRGHLAESLHEVAVALDSDFTRSGSFATLFDARVTLATGEVEYVDAGLGLAGIINANGTFHRLTSRGLPLGIDVATTWPNGRVVLGTGETLVVMSDGVWQGLGESDAVRTAALVREFIDCEVQVGLESLLRDAQSHSVRDDVTAVVVRRTS